MSRPYNIYAEWRTWLSRRGWLLGSLLLILCALGGMEYYWIEEVIKAERERAVATLSDSLSGLKTEFDFEVSRAVAVFGPAAAGNEEHSVRYAEWLRRAPYPRLLLGVYDVEISTDGPHLLPILPAALISPSAAWQAELARLEPLLHPAIAASASTCVRLQEDERGPLPAIHSERRDLNFMTTRGLGAGLPALQNPTFGFIPGHSGSMSSLIWDITLAGHPAFLFGEAPGPIAPNGGFPMAPKPGAVVPPVCQVTEDRQPAVSSPPIRWALAVFDVDYVTTTLLPELLRRHIPGGSALDYEIRIIDNRANTPNRIIFAPTAPPSARNTGFLHPDRQIDLFAPRIDCFVPSFGRGRSARVNSSPDPPREPNAFSLVEILTRTPSACDTAQLPRGPGVEGRWTLQVNYRPELAERAIATFRRRSVVLSCGMLLVLGVGLFTLILLSERASAQAEVRAELVLGISHELRTPVTVIRVAADNLKKGMVASAGEVREYGQAIATQAKRLSEMIEDTLVFARMQSSLHALDTTPLSAEELIGSSLAACERALSDAGFEVHMNIAPNLPLLEVNARLFGQCLENLIQNVIRYAAAGRWLTIRASKAGRPQDPRVRISIEDRGPGIGAKDLPHVFEAFYRGKNGTASQVAGLGLGLTFVKRVVEAHRGSIEVSICDTGTVFSIVLQGCPHHEQQAHTARRGRDHLVPPAE